MQTRTHQEHSPLDLLTTFAIEGTSAFVEIQRTLLDLMQDENEIVFNGMKERVGRFAPVAAFTELTRRTLDTVLGTQLELLTIASKRSIELLHPEKAGKGELSATMMEAARDAMDAFSRAQKKFLEAVEEETAKSTAARQQEFRSAKKTEVAALAREAASAFIEAQQRLTDIFGQQMNVNLGLALQSMETISPSRLVPVLSSAGKEAKRVFDAEKSVVTSAIRPNASNRRKGPRRRENVKAA